MLGLADRLYTFTKRFKSLRELDVDWRPEVTHYNGSNNSWFCFVPRNVARLPMLRKGLIPSEGEVTIYKMYSLGLIKPNLQQTREGLQDIYEDAMERMNDALQQGHTINILSISLGHAIAIKAAGSIDAKVGTILSLVGSGHLGLAAWDSILTGEVARQSGCNSALEYEKELSAFSAINYAGGVVADNILVRLGTRDLLVPFKYGQELARSLQQRCEQHCSEFNYREYNGADHSTAIFLSAISGVGRRCERF